MHFTVHHVGKQKRGATPHTEEYEAVSSDVAGNYDVCRVRAALVPRTLFYSYPFVFIVMFFALPCTTAVKRHSRQPGIHWVLVREKTQLAPTIINTNYRYTSGVVALVSERFAHSSTTSSGISFFCSLFLLYVPALR